MKQLFRPMVVNLCLISVISTPVFAEGSSDSHAAQQTMQNQINQLQQEVQSLKTQVNATHKKVIKHTTNPIVKQTAQPAQANVPLTAAADNTAQSSGPDSYTNIQNLPQTGLQYLPIDLDVPGQSFVSTGPYIGVPFVYSGGNLIINTPSVNQDVALLNVRKNIRSRLRALGRVSEAEHEHAHLLLSGVIEGQAYYQAAATGPNTTDINLTNAQLDGYLLGPSNWTTGLLNLAYDDATGTSEGSLNNNSRALNSRVVINKAFIILGDFDKTPFYGTLGQMYVPFGTYSSNMISTPLTQILGRTKERALVAGYQQQGTNALYGAAYLFRGDSYVGATNRVSNGGMNIGYRFARGSFSGDIGGGILANNADSVGMQDNGNAAPYFGGFGADDGFGNEKIVHRTPALDLRGLWNFGDHVNLLAEYIGATTAFNPTNLTFNTHGAKPWALNTEIAYTFTAFDKPSSVALGYGKSREALALGLASNRYLVTLNTSLWKNTLESLEFRHDINYAAGNTATGGGAGITQVINGAGKPDSMVTAQFDIYF